MTVEKVSERKKGQEDFLTLLRYHPNPNYIRSELMKKSWIILLKKQKTIVLEITIFMYYLNSFCFARKENVYSERKLNEYRS